MLVTHPLLPPMLWMCYAVPRPPPSVLVYAYNSVIFKTEVCGGLYVPAVVSRMNVTYII
jgi:hypothetical protein